MAKEDSKVAVQNTGNPGKGRCPSCKAQDVALREVNGLYVCEKCANKKFSTKVRKAIEEAFEKQEEQRRKRAWFYRMEVAKRGVRAYDLGNMVDALRSFREYLSILEYHHNVEPDTLQPGFFDPEKDEGEILLIAGIYWDMAKIHDHIKGHHTATRQALNKFVEFSIDRKHVIVASEACRKYIKSGACVNKDDFSNAHIYLRSHLTKCFIATMVFGPDSYEVAVLRKFRDCVLSENFIGRWFIRTYYKNTPAVARLMITWPFLIKLARPLLQACVWIAEVSLVIEGFGRNVDYPIQTDDTSTSPMADEEITSLALRIHRPEENHIFQDFSQSSEQAPESFSPAD